MTGPADIEGVLVRGRREYAVSSLFRRREVRRHKHAHIRMHGRTFAVRGSCCGARGGSLDELGEG